MVVSRCYGAMIAMLIESQSIGQRRKKGGIQEEREERRTKANTAVVIPAAIRPGRGRRAGRRTSALHEGSRDNKSARRPHSSICMRHASPAGVPVDKVQLEPQFPQTTATQQNSENLGGRIGAFPEDRSQFDVSSMGAVVAPTRKGSFRSPGLMTGKGSLVLCWRGRECPYGGERQRRAFQFVYNASSEKRSRVRCNSNSVRANDAGSDIPFDAFR